jgi:ElaA protein
MKLKFKCVHFSELTVYELYSIMALRQIVFAVEQNCPYLDADGKDLLGFHLLGYADLDENVQNTEGAFSELKIKNSELKTPNNTIFSDELVAYTRLLPKGISYENYASIGRVVNAPKVRGHGVGKVLIEESIRQMARLFPNDSVKIGAQSYLLKFYTELGFVSTGEAYLEDDIPHTSMILKGL